MSAPIFRFAGWDGPPSRLQVRLLPAHGPYFTPVLGGEEDDSKVHSLERVEVVTGAPDGPNLLVTQDPLALTFFPRGLHLEAGIALNEIATDCPIKHFPHQGQHAIGLNRGATFDEMIQKRNDITAANIVCFPCPPLWEHFLGQEPCIVIPTLFVDLGVEFKVLCGEIGDC